MKPRVFIASSKEGLEVARTLQEELRDRAECTVWDQDVIRPSTHTLYQLVTASKTFDFRVFVFSPDDTAMIRGQENRVVRDNVILELGLFIGALGGERTFVLVPRGASELRHPSDLAGIAVESFDPDRSDKNLRAALGPAATVFHRAMRDLGPRSEEPLLGGMPEIVQPGELLFADDFAGDLWDRWEYDGNWRISAKGTLVVTDDVMFGGMTKQGALWDNYILEFKGRIVSQCLGVLVRSQDLENSYMLQLTTGYVVPHRCDGGRWRAHHNARVPHHADLSQWSEIQVVADRRSVSLDINGRTAYRHPTFLRLPRGKVGFRCHGTEMAEIRDVRVMALA